MTTKFNSLKNALLAVGASLIFGTAFAQPCTPAIASATLPSPQCLPVQLDGSASTNEDNHFIEIVEVNYINGNTVPGTYYSSWFVGQIGNITDLGAYTGYNFQHGKRYRIKVAVQNKIPGTNTWCTPWHATGHMFVDISSMATCYGPGITMHEWTDLDNCITSFHATAYAGDNLTTSVTFNIGGVVINDNQYSWWVNTPGAAPFAGTWSAKFNFQDGSTYTVSKQYQKCPTGGLDPNGGGPQRVAGPSDNGDVKVFPNPSGGNVTIQNDFNSEVHVEIFAMTGRMIQQLDIEALLSADVDLKSVASGIYLAKITTAEGHVEDRKIVIE